MYERCLLSEYAFISPLLTRLVFGFVSNAHNNADISKNGFRLQKYRLFISILDRNLMIAGKSYQPNLVVDMHVRSYVRPF